MKQRILSVILGLIFLVLFNVLFFVLVGANRNAAIWLSYGFIHVAYFFVLISPLLKINTQTDPALNYAIYSQSFTYFVVEIVVAIGFIIYAVNAQSENIAWPLVIQSILFATFLFILVSNMMANETTLKNEEQRFIEIQNFDETVENIRKLELENIAPETKAIIRDCYSELRYGPVRTHPSVAAIENDIANNICLLQKALGNNDKDGQVKIANELLRKIQERNRILKFIH